MPIRTPQVPCRHIGVQNGFQSGFLEANGKFVAAGSSETGLLTTDPNFRDGLLAQFDDDGTLDPSFGTGGIVRFDTGGNEEFLHLAALPDGKILAAGNREPGLLLARFTASAPSIRRSRTDRGTRCSIWALSNAPLAA